MKQSLSGNALIVDYPTHVPSPSLSKYVHSEELVRMAGETWKKELPHCTAYALLPCSDMLTPQCSAFTWLLFMCSVCTKHLLAKQKRIVENYLSVLPLPLSTQHFIQAKMIRVGDFMYMEAAKCRWVQSLDWTTGLLDSPKLQNTSRTEAKSTYSLSYFCGFVEYYTIQFCLPIYIYRKALVGLLLPIYIGSK